MVEIDARVHKARIIIIVLSLIGLVLSYISLQHHVQYAHGFATGPSFCHISAHFNCEAVNASEWSTLFGIPVASYGLFFYALILLGSLFATTSARILSLHSWAGIVFALSLLASLLSLILFAISEIFIGALCLMCLGTYLVNFIMLAVVWRSAWVGRTAEGVRCGIVESVTLLGSVLGIVRAAPSVSKWRLRVLSVIVLLSGAASVIMPDVLYFRYAELEMEESDPFMQWETAPMTTFDLQLSGGAFGDYYRGELSAPIQIVEFADYECAACKIMHESMKGILEEYSGKYLFVFKNYPLDQACNPEMTHELHQFACTAAFFSRCAGEQGKFWESMNILFLRDADKGELSLENLVSDGSQELSLDQAAVRECMQSGRYREKILRDITAGSEAGLQGTPSIWVNGKLVRMPSPDVLKQIFDSILEQGGAQVQ